jgi:hypothetical protein
VDSVAHIRAGFLGAACVPFVVACGSTSDPEATPNFGIILAYERYETTWYGAATYNEPVKPACSPEPVGDCRFEAPCEVTPTQTTIFDAGMVTIQGMPLERTVSYFSPLPSPILPGDLVEMAAAGSADVPAHAGSVRLPPLVTITEPTVDDGLSIDRSTGFEIAWTGVDEGSVEITIASADNGVTCTVPAQLGRFTVPSAALQRLPATDATTSGAFQITQSNLTKLRPKGWEIWLSASNPIVTGSVALR